MNEVNYIRHLNTVFQQFAKDSRLNPTHISLYMGLFQIWNINRFPDIFFLNREEVMRLSKIGSKSTYHRCIKELHHWSYVIYYPSHNPFKGSQIKILKSKTSHKQPEVNMSTKTSTSYEQEEVCINKHIQTSKNNSKQYNFKNFEIEDFQNTTQQNKTNTERSRYKACTERSRGIPKSDNLKVSNNKNYNEPL